ncbi:MAG: murein biosynthesis integral membrane protein MurJ [Gammaproteobacteria bacterium]
MSKRLLGSAATVSGNTLISRVLGFLRDIVIASGFGASTSADAFLVAFRLASFLRRLFAEGAFSQAFVPVLTEYRGQRDQASARELVACMTGALGMLVLAVVIAGVLGAPVLVMVFAPGFLAHPLKYDLAVEMVRITFPYLGFISLAALAGSVLNTYGRFGVPAFTPVWLNVCLITAAVAVAPMLERPIFALAWGVLAAGAVQLAFQLPFVAKLGLLALPKLDWAHEGVRRVFKLMLPALFGVSIAQINLLIDTLIASFLITGSISWLYFAERMVDFPLGVFGIALATVILPSLSGRYSEGQPEKFSQTLDWGLRWVLVIALPSALGLALLAYPILTSLFQYGAFDSQDVSRSAAALVAYSGGLLAFAYVKVLAPGYFSRQDTKTPVRIGAIAMVANAVLNFILVVPLAHVGLALATSLSACLNAGLLFRGLHKEGVYRPCSGWPVLVARVLVASAAMSAVVLWFRGEPGGWSQADALTRAARLASLVVAGAATYAATLLICGLRPRHLLVRSTAN